uniref:Uncharacterized protein n=1 Tax=Triticum urartu TaxID=4572 RepID=A0A8R7PSX0_TRIUA
MGLLGSETGRLHRVHRRGGRRSRPLDDRRVAAGVEEARHGAVPDVRAVGREGSPDVAVHERDLLVGVARGHRELDAGGDGVGVGDVQRRQTERRHGEGRKLRVVNHVEHPQRYCSKEHQPHQHQRQPQATRAAPPAPAPPTARWRLHRLWSVHRRRRDATGHHGRRPRCPYTAAVRRAVGGPRCRHRDRLGGRPVRPVAHFLASAAFAWLGEGEGESKRDCG